MGFYDKTINDFLFIFGQMFFQKLLFLPFSVLFNLITTIRNKFYDWGLLRSCRFDGPVICIGNLKVGGTGKTPHVEFLSRMLVSHRNTAVLSRGYGRKTKGYLEVTSQSTAAISGDEPSQYKRKFKDQLKVFVCEDRCQGMRQIIEDYPDIDTVLLDDAFQHRRLKAGMYILLTEFESPFFKDSVLPSGWLRENRYGARRADVIIVTKCPESISVRTQKFYERRIRKYAGKKPVFFTRYSYSGFEPLYHEMKLPVPIDEDTNVLCFSGIANPKPFVANLKNQFGRVKTIKFADHYTYTKNDEFQILKKFEEFPPENKIIITTEKDAVKLKDAEILMGYPVFYAPIHVTFLSNEGEFRKLISDFINS